MSQQDLREEPVFAVFDSELQDYLTIFLAVDQARAIINFQQFLQDFIYNDDAKVQSKLKVFRLFETGVFSHKDGKVRHHLSPVHVKDGGDFLNVER